MHSELAIIVREWVRDLGPDDLLFPRIERKKTCYMVKRDLERIGIPYETHEGIADFYVSGRHSHITELLKTVPRWSRSGTGPARRRPNDDETDKAFLIAKPMRKSRLDEAFRRGIGGAGHSEGSWCAR